MTIYYCCSAEGVLELHDNDAAFEWFEARWAREQVWIEIRQPGRRYVWLDSCETATRDFMVDYAARQNQH